MTSTRSIALVAALLGSQAACCIAVVSGEGEDVTGTSGSAGSTGGGTGGSSSGGTSASSTSGGSCTALDPSALAFPIAQVGDCTFDPSWYPDGGPGLIAVTVLISAQPLMQESFGCGSSGTSLSLEYGSPESFSGPPLVPGTYQIPGSLDGGWLRAGYFESGTLDVMASSGSVTFTSVSPGEVSGSFSVVFGPDDGVAGSLSGNFCASHFGNLNLPP